MAPNGCAIDQANPAGGKLAEQSASSRPRLRGKQWTTISERVGERAGNTYFPAGDPMTTRRYARPVSAWIGRVGLDCLQSATHSMRRTKTAVMYHGTGNLRACNISGHQRPNNTARYLGVEVDDAIDIAEKIEI
jgi:hypothetical protein